MTRRVWRPTQEFAPQFKKIIGKGKKLIECTPRESEVLILLAHGLSNKAIALRLGLSPHTVRDHVCSLMQRHGLANRVALAIHASEKPWQIGDDARQYRLTRQPSGISTAEDKWCGQKFHLTEYLPLHP